MAFTFPSSPSLGQRFTPVGGPTYVWTGTTWDATGAAIDLTPYWQNGSTSLQLDGTTSGTTTLQASAVAGTTTATIPARTANVMLDGPAFSATASSGTNLGTNTWTKINLTNEEYDTNNNYSASRFTPSVVGYYQINGAMSVDVPATNSFISIYKNGSAYRYGSLTTGIAGVGSVVVASSLVYLNGTTDYVELYGQTSAGGNTVTPTTFFNGCLMRGA